MQFEHQPRIGPTVFITYQRDQAKNLHDNDLKQAATKQIEHSSAVILDSSCECNHIQQHVKIPKEDFSIVVSSSTNLPRKSTIYPSFFTMTVGAVSSSTNYSPK
jgi:hypothetical protein